MTETLSNRIFTELTPTGNSPSDYERVVYARDVREAVKKLNAQIIIRCSELGENYHIIRRLIDEIFGKELK